MKQYVALMMLWCLPMLAVSADFVEGQDYQVISGGNEPSYKGGPVPVTEFFSYGCAWCFRLDSGVTKWVQKEGSAIQFSRVPVVFNPSWENYARAYYLIDGLSLGKKVHDHFFNAIIVEKQPLTGSTELIAFFSKNGVAPQVAESIFSASPTVDLKLKEDAALMGKFQINAVPTLVINQHYKTNMQFAKSEERLFEIASYLVDKVKKK